MEKKRKERIDGIVETYSGGVGMLEDVYNCLQAGKDNDAMRMQIKAARNDLDVKELILDVEPMDGEERKYFLAGLAPVDKAMAEVRKKTGEYIVKKLEEKMKKHFPNGDSEPHPHYVNAYM